MAVPSLSGTPQNADAPVQLPLIDPTPMRLNREKIGVHEAPKRHEIHVLQEAGLTFKEVAEKAKVGVRMV